MQNYAYARGVQQQKEDLPPMDGSPILTQDRELNHLSIATGLRLIHRQIKVLHVFLETVPLSANSIRENGKFWFCLFFIWFCLKFDQSVILTYISCFSVIVQAKHFFYHTFWFQSFLGDEFVLCLWRCIPNPNFCLDIFYAFIFFLCFFCNV